MKRIKNAAVGALIIKTVCCVVGDCPATKPSARTPTTAKYIPVELETLVENVFVAPNSPDWYSDLVAEVTKQFAFSFNILKSELNDTSLH